MQDGIGRLFARPNTPLRVALAPCMLDHCLGKTAPLTSLLGMEGPPTPATLMVLHGDPLTLKFLPEGEEVHLNYLKI